jgi:hypothetical protein
MFMPITPSPPMASTLKDNPMQIDETWFKPLKKQEK